VRVLNECNQSHQGVFDRTKVCSIAFVQECVCDVGLYARTDKSEFEHKPMSAIERIVVRSIPECKFFIFYFLNIYKHK
jgi:hypothetical protein